MFYRLNVLSVELPPLAERREDIPLLADALLARAARDASREAPHLSPEVVATLIGHSWPGNVRELENEMRRLVVLADGVVRLEHLSAQILGSAGGGAAVGKQPIDVAGDLRAAVAGFEASAISDALEVAEGNKSRAASALGLSRFALQRKMEKYGLSADG